MHIFGLEYQGNLIVNKDINLLGCKTVKLTHHFETTFFKFKLQLSKLWSWNL